MDSLTYGCVQDGTTTSTISIVTLDLHLIPKRADSYSLGMAGL